MMNKYVKYTNKFVGDFETSVYKGQQETEVWASALVELLDDEPMIFNSIEATFNYLDKLSNSIVYYHNLKFDGTFWLNYLLRVLKYKQAYTHDEKTDSYEFMKDSDMPDGSFKYLISSMGQWYSVTIRTERGIYIKLLDSYKLLPFSVKKIGKDFDTEHKKSKIDYVGERHAGGVIEEYEKEYISNDVLVVKEALNVMFKEKHSKMTIGSCCLSEFKKGYSTDEYGNLFPDLSEALTPNSVSYDSYIRESYHGGWCYLVKGKENKVKQNGVTADVNSLYPSMMHSQSGNRYPVGNPSYWIGDIPKEALCSDKYFFVRIKTRFYLKENKLPFIQVKRNPLYKSTECLETSDVLYQGDYYKYIMKGNEKIPTKVEMTLTCTDWYLLNEHYNLEELEVLDGCYFDTKIGIFDKYIDKYKKIKMSSKGAKRQIAKLFLNNLYGKMASSTESDFKICTLREDGSLGFFTVIANDKKAGYIPVGSAITSYARNFTIRAAQANYYGKDKSGFIYADTDSIHCDIPLEELKGIDIDPKEFCCFAIESEWDEAIFVRQKTYIEHVVKKDNDSCEKYYDIKCAGMPQTSKKLFELSMKGADISKNPDNTIKVINYEDFSYEDIHFIVDLDETALEFISKKRDMTDFKSGLVVPGKLLPKQITGGTILSEVTFTMKH